MQDRTELPLADYDHLSVDSLAHRVRSLGEHELATLMEYEREHSDRPAVIALLNARITELAEGGQPSPGGSEPAADQPRHSSAGSPVSPDGAAEPSRPQRHARPDQTPRGGRP